MVPDRLQNLGCWLTVEIKPALVFIVIQLGCLGRFEIPSPAEFLYHNPFWQHFFKTGLCSFQLVQRNTHINVMGSMLKNVMHECTKMKVEGQMHGCGNKRLCLGPLNLVIMPNHFGMC